ncbi:LPXTG cell wall anchor domain-containing protein [Neobacillus sp. SM06]|uniref:LPXTG cell wall anchor domain-containing protein n=1 Tax=Neobacillus sp. SM06 TaxID=3422492 RepID=UPI003D2695F2
MLKEKNVPIVIQNDNVQAIVPLGILTNGKSFTFKLDRRKDIDSAKSPVYNFTIVVDGKSIHQFSVPITLNFDVDLSKVKEPKNLKVFYYNENTKEWDLVPGAVFNNGKVTVNTPHFSTFTVFEVSGNSQHVQTASAPSTEYGLPDTGTSIYNYLLAGILLVIIGATLLVYRRKMS